MAVQVKGLNTVTGKMAVAGHGVDILGVPDLTRYIVGTDADDFYATIQEGIDAAVAGGASAASPAIVLVKPGDYTENVTIHPGVYVMAFGGNDRTFAASLTGSLTFAAAAPGTIYDNFAIWIGIDLYTLTGVPDPVVRFRGTNPQQLRMYHCDVTANNATSALEMSNTGSGSMLVAFEVNFQNAGAGVGADVQHGKLSAAKCQINAATSAGTAAQFANASQCEITTTPYARGKVVFTGTAFGLWSGGMIDAGVQSAIETASAGAYPACPIFVDTVLQSSAGTGLCVSGTGNIAHSNLRVVGTATTITVGGTKTAIPVAA